MSGSDLGGSDLSGSDLGSPSGADVLRVGNCSGFYGDRLSALREMLEGGDLDVVTGDYLAELTMLILGRDQLKDPSLGYARTFVRQVEDCLALALEKGVRIVANAGGLNPAGLAARLREVADAHGLRARIAWVDGDHLGPRAAELGWEGALTANAYLGGFGIARALEAGADVVVTGRVTDASLVVGPAVWRFGWTPDHLDELAGAVVAGHVIECGPQATGGNYSGFLELPRDGRPLGFPLAEVHADGSSVITKHPGTGGRVSVDTVTAQLMYEVQSRHYLGPDVTVDLGSVALAQEGQDRVRVSGVRGLRPPARLKVCVNELGGFRNRMEFVLTGLDLEEKAAWLRAQLAPHLRAASVTWSSGCWPEGDADTEEGASVLLRCTVKDPDRAVVDRAFTAAGIELALASYPGFNLTAPPAPAAPYGVYRAAYVDRSAVEHTVHLPDGSAEVVPDPPTGEVGEGPFETGLRPSSGTRAGGGEMSGELAGDMSGDGVSEQVPEEVAQQPSRRAGELAGESVSESAGPFETGLRPSSGARVGAGESAGEMTGESVSESDGPFETGLRPSSGTRVGAGESVSSSAGERVSRRVPLGTVAHARSGDKGGDANVGVWARAGELQAERAAWLTGFLTADRVRTLLPEAADLDVEVHALPNLHGVNVLLRGLLGDGVAASTRFDPQAKAVGEWLRSRLVDVPEELL